LVEIRVAAPRPPRAYVHSHIRGLGLDERGRARKVADGLVGQEEAREAAGVIVEMVREGKLSGRGVLIVGPPGTGKTAIAIAMARELGHDTPFVAINAGELYFGGDKIERLMQALRKAIGVRIREVREVYEGVVSELEFIREESPFHPYPVIEGARLTLETTDDSLTITVGPEIAAQLYQLGVREGDVIAIDAETGAVRLLGRGRGRAKRRYDLSLVREVEIPRGRVRKRKEFTRVVTLHDIDLSMAAQRVAYTGFISFFEAERGITSEDRKRADELVKKWIDEGKAEIVAGVMFIDDAHLLDLEAFAFLTKAMESEFAPVIVLATNRGITKIRGTDIESPHGMPRDLLDRLLIITTRPYTKEEIREILRIRADEEEVALTDEALEVLTEIGYEKSLRYAIQLMEPSRIVALRRGSTKVEPEDVREAERLFADLKRSVELVEKYKDLMLA